MATFDTANNIFDLADQLGLLSSRLLRYRIRTKPKLSPSQYADLLNLELQLDKATADVRAAGVAELGAITKDAKAEVIAAVRQADAFLSKVRKVEKVIGLLTACVTLGLAVISKKPGPILAAAKTVKDAIKGVM